MSHISTIKTKFKSVEYLRKAIGEQPMALIENVPVRSAYGQMLEGEITGYLEGEAFAFQMQDGEYVLHCDRWGFRNDLFSNFEQALTQAYAYHAAVEMLTAQGYEIFGSEMVDGNRVITMGAMS
jgi:hypothetical protein